MCDGFIVQGLCVADEYYIISAYSKKRSKSRLYFYEKNNSNYLGFIILDNSSHVGGVTYDYKNNVLFVTGFRGAINAYNFLELKNLLINNDYVVDLNKYDLNNINIKCNNFNISKLFEDNVSAATIYYYEDFLYVATCSCNGSLVKCELNFSIDMKSLSVKMKILTDDLPSCVQGLVMFTYNNYLFLVLSQSYGRVKSNLKLYKLINNDLIFIGQKRLNYIGLEGIEIDNLGNILCVFENGKYITNTININKLCNKINYKLENKYIIKGMLHKNKLNNF